ncbi:hypothetical protein KIF53_15635 [Chromobacterium subtsugae]|uniref:Uncharacterized protein n=1 Tax=Chromobacterium subtsugae TaxID=251747 RepID=A0ABS7FG66_9NEIS|nr:MULTISPECIES: hypothetical protein [Chromobacterium]KUM02728.1 hypothetical protein Cv017_01365 [Chromobacterium subtsugae]KZE84947.1 hypothetical protein AWB61_02920 [Chromobacterium sp. F49]MBW7567838.1 hypothetical protein [Chromobacterium subtsugae]MBW8289065.1 hypothetical protein [Chromobacterium subtsugae]WSE93790.1 hypothetical protein U6115_11260 [Chromobacterium subtsugae]
MLNADQHLMGIPVVVNDIATHTARIQVRASFEWITEAARRDMNAWLLERFGTQCRVLNMGGLGLIICPHVMERLKRRQHANP